MSNPRKPFKVICTNCGKEILVEHQKGITFDKEPIEVWASPFYDSAIIYMECECGNEIEK